MKRIIILLIFLVIIVGCQKEIEPEKPNPGLEDITGKYVIELEKTACDTAHTASTCDTRLASLGFITKEDCCKKYKKCC
jgi:hypothetical protein